MQFKQTTLKAISEGLELAIPRGGVKISSWAEKYRYVSSLRSADRAGYWRNSLVPYLVEIMDTVIEPDVRKVVFQKSSQVAGTEFLVNVLAFYMHQDPCPMMYVGETEDKAKSFKSEAFDPTIAESPELRRCLIDLSGTGRDDNQRGLKFRGGQLTIAHATSPAELSSRPVKILAIDETDRMKSTREGDPIKIVEARTKTFRDSKKILLVSSPADKETSIIEREYLMGDQREFYVPCPHCGEFQTLKWGGPDANFGVKFDHEMPEDAMYLCEHCQTLIEHDEKPDMLAAGKWIASAPFRGTASFKINELCSPFTTWGDMAEDFLQAKKHRDTLRVFINTRLGETWVEDGEKIDDSSLRMNREEYAFEVPDGVQFLTAGIDVQGDRLECEVVGWGANCENWSIDYRVIHGSPSMPDVWNELSDHLKRAWEGSRGEFRVKIACIDSGGHHTNEVYRFCREAKRTGKRWYAVKGSSIYGKPIISKPTTIQPGYLKLFVIGTDAAKDEIFGFFQVERPVDGEPTPGYCHFPESYGDDHFKQLASEKKVPKYRAGRAIWVYEKISESPNWRNEALDCRVYATAAREIVNPRSDRRAKRQLATEITEHAETVEPVVDEEMNDEPKPTNVVPMRRPLVQNNPFGDFKL